MVSHSAQAKFRSHIHIALFIFRPLQADIFRLVFLPISPTVDTFNRAGFAFGPVIKTRRMDIVAAGSFAPHNVFAFLELHDTYWTVILD